MRRINKSQCFTVMADETTDVTGIEQFSVRVRYVDKTDSEYKIWEDFLCFIPVEDITGIGLANTLLFTLKTMGINLSYMRAEGKL